MTTLHLATANAPGAIALLQLHGPDAQRILEQLTGRAAWSPGRIALCHFADIDEGLAVSLSRDGDTASQWVQLMPHGGPRVVQRLLDHLIALGCRYESHPDARAVYPEAGSAMEADVLHAIAIAASPAAIDRLAAQPALWQALAALPQADQAAQRKSIAAASQTLDRLITPPSVVVVGRANVGKSTLTNALSGRAVSIVADLPGTTRDWVGSLVELEARCPASDAQQTRPTSPTPLEPQTSAIGHRLVAVNWLDTPGLRVSDDTVEQRAITLARSVIDRADALVVMRDAENDWPDTSELPRTPGLWVMNKCDDASREECAGVSPAAPLRISAERGHGLTTLQHRILEQLGLAACDESTPWAFSKTLRDWATGEAIDLDAYLHP